MAEQRPEFQELPRLWDVKGWLRAILSREPHPFLQFVRYGIAGVAAMAANMMAFWLCIRFVFLMPENAEDVLQSLNESGSGWADWLREMRQSPEVAAYVKANSVAFVAANVVAYVLNFKWVFESGRHSRQLEILLFFGVSLLSFLIGTALASVMVGSYGINEYVAKISDVIFAVLINYLCRKFLVFSK